MTKKTGLFLLGWLLTVASSAAGAPQRGDLVSADWSVNASPSLEKDPPSQQMVWNFINHFWDESFPGGRLCSFRFVDLRHAGELSLVAVYDGGRPSCNFLTVFDKRPTGVEVYSYDGGRSYADAKDIVTDINDDGHLELVVPLRGESPCNDDWPIVYAWTGSGYTDVSSQYPKYYETWLASLKGRVAALEAERARAAQPIPKSSPESGPTVSVLEDHWQSASGSSPATITNSFQQQAPQAAPSASEEAPPLRSSKLLVRSYKLPGSSASLGFPKMPVCSTPYAGPTAMILSSERSRHRFFTTSAHPRRSNMSRRLAVIRIAKWRSGRAAIAGTGASWNHTIHQALSMRRPSPWSLRHRAPG